MSQREACVEGEAPSSSRGPAKISGGGNSKQALIFHAGKMKSCHSEKTRTGDKYDGMKVVARPLLIYLQPRLRGERRRPGTSRPGPSGGDLGQ